MTALAASRTKTHAYGEIPLPATWEPLVKASAKGYAGGIGCIDSATGYYVKGSAALGLICLGRTDFDFDNTGGSSGAIRAKVTAGCYKWNNSTAADQITIADLWKPCFIVDDQTVARTDGGNVRSICGLITGVDTDGVYVLTGLPSALLAALAAGGGSVSLAPAVTDFKQSVRAASTANASDLTAVSTTMDGVTLVAGDRILLKNQTTAGENGIYVVGTVVSTTAPVTRATDADSAADFSAGIKLMVEEGTVAAGKEYRLTTTGAITLGTTALAFVPYANKQTLSGVATLVGGTVTITAAITAGSKITYGRNTTGGTAGHLSAPDASRNVGAGTFVIQSSSGTETSTVDWVAEG